MLGVFFVEFRDCAHFCTVRYLELERLFWGWITAYDRNNVWRLECHNAQLSLPIFGGFGSIAFNDVFGNADQLPTTRSHATE